jgi:uncharacterized membrane protein
MMSRVETLALADDVPAWAAVIVLLLLVLSIGFLLDELRRSERLRALIAVTGVLSVLLLAAAVVRPVSVTMTATTMGPRVVVLVDQSRRLLLPAGKATRRERALESARRIKEHFGKSRVSILGFGEGAPQPLSLEAPDKQRLTRDSDLVAALDALANDPGERPRAVVVVSDGRLSRPLENDDTETLQRALGRLDVPIHTVSVTRETLPDAAVAAVRAAGAAVAHQPLALTVEVACTGGLSCDRVPVTVRELRRGVEPGLLASGVAEVREGRAIIELEMTLDRAGDRVVEVAIEAPPGDTIKDNDRRLITFSVTRDRIRLLHLAGRPTYDVRALRRWLKSDESVDLVAFFILRTKTDNLRASDDELALIPFPVHELFETHLPSFDAVILQDIDAVEYELSFHLSRLARYVSAGGGLIMVGGANSFAGGRYQNSEVDRVLPAPMIVADKRTYDLSPFVPRYTESGRAAPVLRAVRELLGEGLPTMPAVNLLGPPREQAVVLWEHPTLGAPQGNMPVLSLGESGDGRSIALGIDGTHLLAFSEFAAETAGRAYGALWDGLLGWLMRDPRYEPTRVELVGECVAGEPPTLRVARPGTGVLELVIERLGPSEGPVLERKLEATSERAAVLELPALEAAGYTARLRVGAAPPTRLDFACEPAGSAFSRPQPSPALLQRIAKATDGRAVEPQGISDLPEPAATAVAAERHVAPLLPAWVWSLAAAAMLGVHWLARRRGSLG